ncbi:MAG: transcriptional repressor LexA [Chloroflexi bacterium]|nr:transcriptional repressor LexA [Chloroflexota bacterium]
MDLSPRQKSILEFIRKFVQENGYPPTIREIGRAANISSTSVVNYNLNILQAKGYIQRDREVSRGVKLLEKSLLEQTLASDQGIVQVPVLGRIVASEPVPIPDEPFSPLDVDESIALTRDIVQEQGPIYALQVKGDSMIDALVYDGDIVIMKAQKEAKNGDLVAAWLKAEKETTLKRFYRESTTRVRLQPANPNLKPIYVHPSNLEIQGKVIAVIRQL